MCQILTAGQTLAADSAAPDQPGRSIKLNWRLVTAVSQPKKPHTSKRARASSVNGQNLAWSAGVSIQTAHQCTCSMKITNCFCTEQANLRPFYFLLNHETIAFCPKPKQTITWEACYGL